MRRGIRYELTVGGHIAGYLEANRESDGSYFIRRLANTARDTQTGAPLPGEPLYQGVAKALLARFLDDIADPDALVTLIATPFSGGRHDSFWPRLGFEPIAPHLRFYMQAPVKTVRQRLGLSSLDIVA